VGAGPAGVSAAFELSRLGHAVTLYEREKEAGGLNRYGIAEYKIGSVFVQKELEFLLSLGGVDIRLSASPVNEIALSQLLTSYHAVLLAIGLGSTRKLDIPGQELPRRHRRSFLHSPD
jgi:glutamate synthase (NADPH/NADH) small chain